MVENRLDLIDAAVFSRLGKHWVCGLVRRPIAGCDEDEEAFDEALGKIASEKPPASVQKRKKPAKAKT